MGDVQVPTLTPNTPTGLFNHWQLGRGHNMTSRASSLFQSNDTTTAHEVAQTQRWLGIDHDTFLNPMPVVLHQHTQCLDCEGVSMPLRHRRDYSPFLPSRAPLLESCGRGSPTHFTSPLQSQLLTASGMWSDVVPIITTLPPCLDPEFSLRGKRGISAPVHSVTDQTHRLISH